MSDAKVTREDLKKTISEAQIAIMRCVGEEREVLFQLLEDLKTDPAMQLDAVQDISKFLEENKPKAYNLLLGIFPENMPLLGYIKELEKDLAEWKTICLEAELNIRKNTNGRAQK